MKWNSWASLTTVALAMAVPAGAQFPRPGQMPGQSPAGPGHVVIQEGSQPNPMPGIFSTGGVFSFVETLSDVSSQVVKGEPFSAEVMRESVQELADGNRIDRKSTGMFARDSQGRTRREMTFQDIGPWASAGQPAHFVIIDDPVARKVYRLNESRKIAVEMGPPSRLDSASKEQAPPNLWSEFQGETKTESLGEKRMEGLMVEGMETIQTIPAGQIGNEKPIVITSERWYSPDLQTTIWLTRTDPRFGTSMYRLTNINLSEPAQSLFAVPSNYTIRSGKVFRQGFRRNHVPDRIPDFP